MAKQRTDTQSVINLVINGKQALTTQKELTDTQRKLNAELRNMKPADPKFKQMADEARMVTKAIQEQKAAMNGVSNETSKFAGVWKQVAGGAIAANLAMKAASFLADLPAKIVEAYGVAEKNRAVLTNALNGDAKQAGQALDMLMDFAAKTPFAMNEAVGGYIKLVNRGIIPTREEMVKLGDIAASQGKNMDMLVEAILDAQTGEMERLKEFGIRGKKNGDMVAFSFKGVTKEVQFTEEAIKDALLSFGEMNGVSGTMESVSDTIVGLQSNIADTWDQIYTKLGQKSEGFINGIYSLYSNVLNWINDDLLSVESAGQKAAKMFSEQASMVSQLTNTLDPLLNRYDELKNKGELNKNEQAEIKDILEQVAATIPSAVSEWDKLGNAMDINTQKARDFIAAQRAMLIVQNKDTVDTLQNEIKKWTSMRDTAQRQLNSGKISQTIGGASAMGTTLLRPLTNAEYADLRKQVVEFNEKIKLNSDAISGLNGNHLAEKKTPSSKTTDTGPAARTEGVIKKEIEALEKLRSSVAVASKEYKSYTEQIGKLEDELSSGKGKGKKTNTDKKIESLEKEHDKLKELSDKLSKDFEAAKKGPLEEALNKISAEYDPLIEKAKKFKDEALAGLFAQLKKGESEKVKLDFETKDKEKADKDAKDKREKDFKAADNTAKIGYTETSNDIVSGYISELDGVSTEEQAFALKEKYRALEEAALEEHLLALKMLYEAYGEDTSQIDADLVDLRLQNAEREAQGKIEWTLAKQEIESAYLDIAQQGTAALMGLVNRQSALYKGLLVLDKALAIAKIITNLQAEIAGYYAKYALVPGGQIIASAQAAAAKVRAGISVGIVAATGIAELAATNKDSGDAYATGVRNAPAGKKLVGEAGSELIEKNGKFWITDGPQLINFSGGENVYSASETAKMYSSNLYPALSYSVDRQNINDAERKYRSIDIASALPLNSSENPEILRLMSMVEELVYAIEMESSKKIVNDYKDKEKYEKKLEYERSIQTA